MVVKVNIKNCCSCPDREDWSGGIGGDYRYCSKSKKEIHGDNAQKDFPDWCVFNNG